MACPHNKPLHSTRMASVFGLHEVIWVFEVLRGDAPFLPLVWIILRACRGSRKPPDSERDQPMNLPHQLMHSEVDLTPGHSRAAPMSACDSSHNHASPSLHFFPWSFGRPHGTPCLQQVHKGLSL
eukprot:3137790-Amphidinium_carterae.1